MKSFRDKFPGLTEEQIRIKYKLWEKEKEKEKEIRESIERKRKNPFKEDDEGDEGGVYAGSLDLNGTHGVVSDAALVSSDVTFSYSNGNKVFTKTDSNGLFNLVIENMSHLTDIKIPNIDKGFIFNQDHVKVSLDGFEGAKEIQAINTIIEIYSDLIGALKSNSEDEIISNKIQTYKEIGNSLLTKVNGQESINYMDDIFKFHLSHQEKIHESCCSFPINKAIKSINKALLKDTIQATKEIQALNLAVKSEWCDKSLHMTMDSGATPQKIWDSIDKKNPLDLIDSINI